MKIGKFRIPKLAVVSGSFVLLFLLIALFAPWIANEPTGTFFPLVQLNPQETNILRANEGPSYDHYFGTDHVGRDIFARLVHGIRNSLLFGLLVVIICIFNGTLLGGIMGFFGGRVDLILQRFMEIIGNFPIFLLQLTLLAFAPQGYGILLFVMCLAGWIPYCRFVRAEFLKLRNQEFVQAARAIGGSRSRTFFRHLLPNSLTPVITYIPFDLSTVIITLGALSFLGFGEPIDVASIGELLRQAQGNIHHGAWWLVAFPGGALFILTLSLALFGSSVRDILDPRQTDS